MTFRDFLKALNAELKRRGEKPADRGTARDAYDAAGFGDIEAIATVIIESRNDQ